MVAGVEEAPDVAATAVIATDVDFTVVPSAHSGVEAALVRAVGVPDADETAEATSVRPFMATLICM